MDADYISGKPLEIGDRKQLFLDDFIIEDCWALRRKVCQPLKFPKNPVLTADKPWEDDACCAVHVEHIPQNNKFRMWYLGHLKSGRFISPEAGDWPPDRRKAGFGPCYFMSYAESDDGCNWTKPMRDGENIKGFTRHNILFTGHNFCCPGAIMRNPQGDDPSKTYLLFYRDMLAEGKCSCLAWSRDGINWVPDEKNPVQMGSSDTFCHPVYDEKNRQYLFYYRPFVYASGLPMKHGPHTHYRRRIALSTTADFRHYSCPRCVMFPWENDRTHFDNIRLFRYEDYFMGFLACFDESEEGLGDIYLAWSRDGIHWDHSPADQPFIARGPEGTFDHGLIIGSTAPLQVGNHLYMYYRGLSKGHFYHNQTGGMGLAKTGIDRFVAVRADDEYGYLLTKELMIKGKRLAVNVSADMRPHHPPGEIRAALVRRPERGGFGAEQALPGFGMDDCDPIQADSETYTVTWNHSYDLSALQGRPVYIRFRLRNAELFAFQFVT